LKLLLERSRYLLLIAVFAPILASAVMLIFGAYKTVATILNVVGGQIKASMVSVAFIEVMDAFLVGAVLYIFGIAIYELFIGELELPNWLVIHNLDELKSKLISVIVLVIVISFAEHFVEFAHPQDLLWGGLGAAAVIAALVLFNRSHTH
jgi:uncharacterized membrane protein YqhA